VKRYLLAFVVVFGILELGVRRWVQQRPLHWDGLESVVVAGGAPDFLFLGTSRVAAAIDADVFARDAGSRVGRAARAVNLGIGHYTLTMHYLGARDLLRDHPDALRGTTVFIEAPFGLQEALTWRDRWYYPGSAKLLVPLLTVSDLPRIWKSDMRIDEKAYLSFFTLTHASALLTYRERIGEGVIGKGSEKTESLAIDLGAATNETEAVDLTSDGGIQTDPNMIDRISRLAIEGFREERALPGNQRSLGMWDNRVLADLVELIKGAGGQVVFFEIPLHSAQASIRSPAVRAQDQREFAVQAARWGTPIVHPRFDYSDRDFPDVFHLRRSRAAEYTTALYSAWVGSERGS
jgi:hypothetical protein